MSRISERVIQKIKKGKITPAPRWRFILKDSVVWSMFVANFVFGSVGVAVIIFLIAANDIVWGNDLALNLWQRVVMTIPVIWFVLTAIFFVIAYYNFKNTPEGYRYTAIRVFLGSIVVAIILGTVMYFSGLSERLNTIFDRTIPYYSTAMDPRQRVWMRPQEGYLAGEIQSHDGSSQELVLIDFGGNYWQISYDSANVRHGVKLILGERVKLTGHIVEDGCFEATEIRPWSGRGKRMQER